MAFTYSGDPADSDLDKVRFLIGDTDSSEPLLHDAEINYLISLKDNLTSVAIDAVGYILALFARLVDQSVGDIKVSYSQRIKAYQKLIERLSRQLDSTVQIYAGGMYEADMEATEADTSLAESKFKIGMMENE